MTDTVTVFTAALSLVAALGLVGLPARTLPDGDRRRRSPSRATDSPAERLDASVPVALVLDLVAAVLEAGAPPAAALRTVGVALAEVGDEVSVRLATRLARYATGLEAGAPGGVPAEGDPPQGRRHEEGRADGRVLESLWSALELAAAAGVSPAAPVRQASATARRRAAAARLVALRRLEVRLVLPTGLCFLPAFVLLGVAPVVLDLIRA